MPSRTLSLRKKLFILLAAVIISLLLLLGTTNYFNGVVNQLESTKSALQQTNINVLQLRRNEKDFIMRKSPKYVEKHQGTYEKLRLDFERLEKLSSRIGSDIPTAQLTEKFSQYQHQFELLVNAMTLRGLDSNSGKYAELRGATHELEAIFNADNNLDNKVTLLMMRRHEKDYMLRGDEKYITKLAASIDELRANVEVGSQSYQLIEKYEQTFNNYAAIDKQIGLSPTQGVRGEMRSAIYEAEQLLHESILQATQYVEGKERLSVAVSYVIFFITSTALTIFIFKLINIIISPIKTAVDNINDVIEKRDFTIHIEKETDDEFGKVIDSINNFIKFTHKINSAVEDLRSVSNAVEENAQKHKHTFINNLKEANRFQRQQLNWS